MSTPVPPSIVEAFAAAGARNTVPVTPSATPGAASYDLGFPPVTMIPRIAGGIPPDGQDVNGVMYDLSAHTLWVASGGQYRYDAAIVAKQGGYPEDVVLQSASDPSLFFRNTLNGNTNDPDSVLTGWAPFSVLYAPLGAQLSTPAGALGTLALDAGVGFLEVTPTANSTLESITGAYEGQRVIVTNRDPTFTLKLLGSGNFCLPTDGLTLTEKTSVCLTWYATASEWKVT